MPFNLQRLALNIARCIGCSCALAIPRPTQDPLKPRAWLQLCRGCMDEYLAWSQSHA